MIYVGHVFRWQPEQEGLLEIARRWDYQWCRLWSDRSFEEMSEFWNNIRGKTWLWRQDGESLPYYLCTPVFRERAIRKGAIIKDWDNPQLPANTKPTYRGKLKEKERETLSYQRETQGGSIPIFLTEEDLLATASVVRGIKKNAHNPSLHKTGNSDPSHAKKGSLLEQSGDVDSDLP
jgi:hypothetical protein